MNKIEKGVYDLVKNNPKMKNMVRNAYQSMFDLLPDKEDYSLNPVVVKEGYFFGFHDVSPFSCDEKLILANRLEIPLRMPVQGDPLTVGYWDSKMSNYTEIKKTYAWNYHKGCRLQWIGKEQVIFNDCIDNKLCAQIYSMNSGNFRTISYPIDSVDLKGVNATSFSYERLNRYMPGYGYCNSDDSYLEEKDSKNTGLFIVNLLDESSKLVVSLKELSLYNRESTMDNANHYVTHTKFSPDGERIAFLHRWTFDDPDKRYTRLVTCKLDGSELYVSNTTGMVSHYDWDKKNGIVAYCQVGGVDGHYVFADYKMDNPIRVASTINSDGHQSYVPDENKFVTDTYPDRRRRAKIYMVDIKNEKTYKIVDVKSPKQFQSPSLYEHWACDLHPRVSPLGNYICFDSVHTGKRALCVMSIVGEK